MEYDRVLYRVYERAVEDLAATEPIPNQDALIGFNVHTSVRQDLISEQETNCNENLLHYRILFYVICHISIVNISEFDSTLLCQVNHIWRHTLTIPLHDLLVPRNLRQSLVK